MKNNIVYIIIYILYTMLIFKQFGQFYQNLQSNTCHFYLLSVTIGNDGQIVVTYSAQLHFKIYHIARFRC